MACLSHRLSLCAALLAVVWSYGCEEEFTAASLLETYRVMGVKAEPAEPTPEDTVTLTVYDFDPSELTDSPDEIVYEWRLCLFSLGSVASYECIDPSLEFVLDATGPTVTLDLNQSGGNPCDASTLNVRECLEAVSAVPETEPFVPDLEDGLEVFFKLRSYPATGGPEAGLESVRPLVIRDGDDLNANPTIDGFSLAVQGPDDEAPRTIADGDEVPAKGTLTMTLELADGSAEIYEQERETGPESLLYSWFATNGEVDPLRTFEDDLDAELILPEEPGPLSFFVAVRDGRGGFDLTGGQVIVVAP